MCSYQHTSVDYMHGYMRTQVVVKCVTNCAQRRCWQHRDILKKKTIIADRVQRGAERCRYHLRHNTPTPHGAQTRAKDHGLPRNFAQQCITFKAAKPLEHGRGRIKRRQNLLQRAKTRKNEGATFISSAKSTEIVCKCAT